MKTASLPRVAARPFLKWAGGKRQLLEQFAPLYPQRVERYIEPFAGSAAVFFDLRERCELGFAALSDGNEELINCYQVVRDDVESLIRKLRTHKRRHHESFPAHYYDVRSLDPDSLSPLERAARLIYLNKTGYNGLYRVNARGGFNVPVGSYKDPPVCDPALLRTASMALQGVRIEARDFEDWLADAKKGDFFYIDPPYVPLSKTANFTSYSRHASNGRNTFDIKDQERLAAFVQRLSDCGCNVMVSNSDTRTVRDLYRGFARKKVRARRAINSNGRARGEISELVITNYQYSG
jgi:DNA adenine methylase